MAPTSSPQYIQVRMPDEMRAELDAAAERVMLDRSTLVRLIVQRWLARGGAEEFIGLTAASKEE